MARVKRGFTAHRRHKKVLDVVKGHQTSRGHLFRTAQQEMMRSLAYAYRDRRTRKRDMRSLWIVRINAAARENGLPYSRFMAGVTSLGLGVDRKMLAEMAVNDPYGFSVLAAQVKGVPAPARPVAQVAPAPKAARTSTAAAPVEEAPAAETFAPAPAAEATASVTQPGATETIAEQEAAAAGAPLEHAGTKDEVEEGHGDPQQGESR